MVYPPKSIGPLVPRLLAVLLLLACPRMGSAAGTWSVLSLPLQSGQIFSPWAMASDPVGNLYVADQDINSNDRIQKRDAQGNWSVIADHSASALAVDTAGNLYVADGDGVQEYTPGP